VIKKFLGIDFVDLLIQFGITVPICIMAASATSPQEEIGVSLVVACSFMVLAWRRARALKHLSDPSRSEANQDRIAELEQRVTELEYSQGRLNELEERVDFQERLLVRQRDELKLTPGETAR
jgi:uncharacterized coiled-coil protein SlyX